MDIPSNINILIRLDSTLRTYATPNSGRYMLNTRKNKEMFDHIKHVHPYYQINGKAINGATIRTIYDDLPKTQEDYDKYDCVVIVVNLNQAKGGKVYRADSDQGVEFMRLCIALRRFKRALVIVGGYGSKWNLQPSEAEKWDYMVTQMIGIANHVGTMAISGRKYYEQMESAPDRVHLAQEQPTIDIMVKMVLDGVCALYGAKPAGSFATVQRLEHADESTEQSGIVGTSGASGSDATEQSGLLSAAEQEAEDELTALRARGKVPLMSPEKRASLEVFLANKAKLDRATTEQSGSAGSAYGGPSATSFEQQAAEQARLADFVATSGGTETFPLSFSRLGTQKPRASYVGTLPDCNAPVFDIHQQVWPVVAVAGDPTTKAQRRVEATSKSNKKQVTLVEEVDEARVKYAAELFEKQKGTR
jgi:hypothetical protein